MASDNGQRPGRTVEENTAIVNEGIRLAAQRVGARVQDMSGYYSAGDFSAEPESAEALAAELAECWNEQQIELPRGDE